MDKNLILEVNTKSGSNYKLYKYIGKKKTLNVLRSDSSAFDKADFILLDNLCIDDKLNFIGTVYFNSLIELYEKKYRIVPRNRKQEVMTANMDSVQYTTGIKDIIVHDQKEFSNMIKNKTLNIENKYIEEYGLN